MQFLKSTILLGLIASAAALPSPAPQDSTTDLTKRVASLEEAVHNLIATPQTVDVRAVEYSNPLVTRAKIKDTKCPDNGKTYTAGEISDAVKNENAKENPDKYNNREGNKKLFNTDAQLYKARLDNTVRAVFSRDDKKKYTYRGLIEHDKGTGNGFHLC